jgi:uncharacterized membrane protein
MSSEALFVIITVSHKKCPWLFAIVGDGLLIIVIAGFHFHPSCIQVEFFFLTMATGKSSVFKQGCLQVSR